MVRPRLGESERRTRTIRREGHSSRGDRATGAEPDRGESESNGAGAQLGSRVVARKLAAYVRARLERSRGRSGPDRGWSR